MTESSSNDDGSGNPVIIDFAQARRIVAADGTREICFVGALIAHVTTRGECCDCWRELYLYRTASGGWVCQDICTSQYQLEEDDYRAWSAETFAELRSQLDTTDALVCELLRQAVRSTRPAADRP